MNITLSPALPPGKPSRNPSSRWLGGPQRRSGRFGDERGVLRLPAIHSRVFGLIPRKIVILWFLDFWKRVGWDTGPEYRYLDSRCCSPAPRCSDGPVGRSEQRGAYHVVPKVAAAGWYRCAAEHQVSVSFLGVHRTQRRNGTSGRQFASQIMRPCRLSC